VEKISVVISVVDQEVVFLPRALSSVKEIASEIIIIDMTSSDELFKTASGFRAKIYKHDIVPFVEVVRNFGISKAQGEWMLIMDPDEEVSDSLAKKLKEIVTKIPQVYAGSTPQVDKADYYRLPRKNIIFGKWIKHSRWWPDYNIRFFRKGNVSWNEVIHSIPLTKGKGADLEEKESNAIVHYHYQSVDQYIERMNRYTNAQAKNLAKDGYKFNWRDLIKKPSDEFMSRYFQGEGYKDGLHGLALAGLQGFSEFVVYLKIWQLNKFKDTDSDLKKALGVMKDSESDFHYWQADTLLKKEGGLGQRIKRKFKLP
jgi:(heptosyl)LPS beta-1,4-glucosyltransferase